MMTTILLYYYGLFLLGIVDAQNLTIIFKNETYNSSQVIPLTSVGEGADAVICMTTRTDCCTNMNNETRNGEWFYPDKTIVPTKAKMEDFYRNRESQQVILNRRNNATSPTGCFCCELANQTERICVTLSNDSMISCTTTMVPEITTIVPAPSLSTSSSASSTASPHGSNTSSTISPATTTFTTESLIQTSFPTSSTASPPASISPTTSLIAASSSTASPNATSTSLTTSATPSSIIISPSPSTSTMSPTSVSSAPPTMKDSGPVNELRASSPNNSTLVITWRSPSFPNGDILSYSIVITNLVSGAIVRLTSVVGNENRYMASGLVPGVPYNVSIGAVNGEGLGALLTAIYFTKELTPSIAPNIVQVNRISASVMMVSWTPLSLSEARGFITHYTVAYFPQQSSSKRQEPNPMYKNVSGSDSNQTTINGLEASIDYGVQVSASTNAGSGDFSPVILVRAFSDGVSSAVIAVIIVVILALVIVVVFVVIIILLVLKIQKNKSAIKPEEMGTAKGVGTHTYDTVDPDQSYETIKTEYERREDRVYCEISTNKATQPNRVEEFSLTHCPAYMPVGAGDQRGGGYDKSVV